MELLRDIRGLEEGHWWVLESAFRTITEAGDGMRLVLAYSHDWGDLSIGVWQVSSWKSLLWEACGVRDCGGTPWRSLVWVCNLFNRKEPCVVTFSPQFFSISPAVPVKPLLTPTLLFMSSFALITSLQKFKAFLNDQTLRKSKVIFACIFIHYLCKDSQK